MMLIRFQAWAAAQLLGVELPVLVELTQRRVDQLTAMQATGFTPTILLSETNPARFLAGLIAAVSCNCPVFLCNPAWANSEWQQVFNLVQPDLVFGSAPALQSLSNATIRPQSGWIMIPTGGSSGQIRFAIHTWETLSAAVQGFQEFFAVDRINSCCLLPLYHVSGLMQFVRSFLSEGRLAVLPFKSLERWYDSSGASAIDTNFDTNVVNPIQQGIDPQEFFLSLVPTQLQRLCRHGTAIDWLAQFQTIFLGGAPAWEELLNTARSHHLRLAPTYGMTETAAQIATLPPEQFLQGESGCGQVLPHANATICNEAGDQLRSPQIGTIQIAARSLMLGYFPHPFRPDKLVTDDLGYIDNAGILHLIGRNSQKIITGGENVFPAEIEAALRSTGLVNDVCVIGMPDQTWGEIVTAIYVPGSPNVSASTLKTELIPRLSSFKHPKQWIMVSSLPRNAQGKLDIASLKQIL